MTNKSDDGLDALLQSARNDHDPTDLDQAAVRRALAEKLLHAPPPRDPTVSALSSSLKLWIVGACVVAGLGALATFAATRRRTDEGLRVALPPRVQDPAVVTPLQPSAAGESAVVAANDSIEGAPPASATRIPDRRSLKPSPRSRTPHDRAGRRATASATTPAPQNLQVAVVSRVETASAPSTEERALSASGGSAAAASPTPPAAASAVDVARPVPAARTRAEPSARVTELEWMHRIELALRDGEPRLALELSAGHEQRWPRGLFAQEREGVRALAACQLRLPEGERRARAFLSKHPQSTLAPRVLAECRLKTTTSTR